MGTGLDTPFDISLPTLWAVAVARSVQAAASGPAASPPAAGASSRTTSAPSSRPDIPLTSIYSRGDGVVWWEACVVPYARCVEISGSHVGLAFNRKAYRVVAQALFEAFA